MCDNCGICQTCDLKRSHKAINILGDSGLLLRNEYFLLKAHFQFQKTQAIWHQLIN